MREKIEKKKESKKRRKRKNFQITEPIRFVNNKKGKLHKKKKTIELFHSEYYSLYSFKRLYSHDEFSFSHSSTNLIFASATNHMRAKHFPTTNYILCVGAFLFFFFISIWFFHKIFHIFGFEFELPQYLSQIMCVCACS